METSSSGISKEKERPNSVPTFSESVQELKRKPGLAVVERVTRVPGRILEVWVAAAAGVREVKVPEGARRVMRPTLFGVVALGMIRVMERVGLPTRVKVKEKEVPGPVEGAALYAPAEPTG
jgi:hypothetical protein